MLDQLATLPELEDVLVVLAGKGTLEIPANLNVQLTGGVADPVKRATLFGAADVFVSASLMETYGLTLIEAMSCGIPVVAFRTGGIPEAVPQQAGILCELLDAQAFKTAIQRLRDSEQLRNELGNGGRKLVAARNGGSRFAAAFARVYEVSLRAGQTHLVEQSALVP